MEVVEGEVVEGEDMLPVPVLSGVVVVVLEVPLPGDVVLPPIVPVLSGVVVVVLEVPEELLPDGLLL